MAAGNGTGLMQALEAKDQVVGVERLAVWNRTPCLIFTIQTAAVSLNENRHIVS